MVFDFSKLTFPDGVPVRLLTAYADALAAHVRPVLADHTGVCCWDDMVVVVADGVLAGCHAAAAEATGVVFPEGDHRRGSAENMAAELLFTREMVGVRTHCVTGDESTVPVKGMLLRSTSGLWLHLTVGAVTGFESAPVDRLLAGLADPDWSGWTACAGTPNSYDRLVVTADSIRAAFADIVVAATGRTF